MDEEHRALSEAGDPREALATYLRDHTAGATHAVQLLTALRDAHTSSALHDFVAGLLPEVQKDLAILESLARRVGANGFQMKELAGWLGDKLSRLKLAPLGSPFSTFEALEFLSLGILGKRALWKVLLTVASYPPELQGTDFVLLIERAEAQYAATEAMRLQVAASAFCGG